MGLFKRDLIRSFMLGFVVTATGICMALGAGASGSATAGVVPSAQAAPSR